MGKVEYVNSLGQNSQIIIYDDALSHKNFVNWSFVNRPEYDFNNKVIYGSVFTNETPDSQIFPANLTGATFIKCHLQNVIIPNGNTVIDCLTDRFKRQNDGNDWLINNLNAPIKPINHAIFTKLGLPLPLPKSIPATPLKNPIDLIALAKAAIGLGGL